MISRVKDALLFLQEYIRNPKLVASIIPSSKSLAKALITHSGASSSDVIVEIGSGTGVVTEQIQSLIKGEAIFFSLEINEKLSEVAKKRCPDVEIICCDAKLLEGILLGKGLDGCDAVVSCIPWVTLPESEQKLMIEVIYNALNPGGRFATLLFAPGLSLSSAKRFEQIVEKRFKKSGYSKIVWTNLPPAYVLWAEK